MLLLYASMGLMWHLTRIWSTENRMTESKEKTGKEEGRLREGQSEAYYHFHMDASRTESLPKIVCQNAAQGTKSAIADFVQQVQLNKILFFPCSL